MIGDGLYALEFWHKSCAMAPIGSALAVARNGTILGADPWGGLFTGTYGSGALREVRLNLAVPAGGELVTGFKAGPEGAAIDLVAVLDSGDRRGHAAVEITGEQIDIQLAYLGEVVD